MEIEVPDGMNQKTAQQCFLVGLKLYTSLNNAEACVAYGSRNEDGKEELELLSFKGEYAYVLMRFCQGMRMLKEQDHERNLAVLRDQGSDMLKELEHAQDTQKHGKN